MAKKQSRLLHQLESLVGRRLARAGLLRRTLRFIFLAALGLILAVAVPLTNLSSPLTADAGGEVARAATPQELIRQGRDYYQSGQFEEAAEVLHDAAAVYEDLGNPVAQSRALSYLSLAYQQLGNWDEAEAAIAASLQLLPVTEDIADSQRRARALARNARGRLQLARGQAEAAFATWEKAAGDYEQLGDKEGSSGARLNQAQALEEMGRYRRSCNILLKVLSLENQTCDELEDKDKSESMLRAIEGQSNSPLKASALRSLGNVLRSVGQLDRSVKVLDKSLAVAQNSNSAEDESLSELYLGNTKRALAKREKEFDEEEKAEEHRQAALEHYQKAEAIATSPTTKLLAQLNRLSLLAESEEPDSSEKLRQLLEEIKTQIQDLPASPTTVKARINLAYNLMRLVREERETILKSDSEDAKNLLDDAVKEAQDLESRRLESYAIGTLGKWYEYAALGLGQSQQKDSDRELWQEAEKNTRLALDLANESEAADLVYQWQWQMGRLLRSAGNVEGAIARYAKAVGLLKSLRKNLAVLNSDIQFDFRDEVEPVYRQYVDLLLRSENPSQNYLKQAREATEALQIAELDNFFRDRCLESKEVNIDEVVDRLDPSAALIYTILLQDRLEVIAKLPQRELRHYKTLESEAEKFTTFLANLKEYLPQVDRNTKVKKDLKKLYQWIIKPIESQLTESGVEQLVFVLDDRLQNIPMGALYDGKKYLIEKYAIAVTPGLSLLGPKPLQEVELNILAAGISQSIHNFPELPGVESELEEIEQLLPTQVLFNHKVTRQEIQNRIGLVPFSLVHMATHGNFSSNPEETFILLYEGRLKVNKLNNLLQTDDPSRSEALELLVLSACQTAKGDPRAALGLAGVAVRAGAGSTLATLWPVNDDATAELITQFYQQLSQGVTKAKALQTAQLALLYKNDDWKRPYLWAPYVLVGNWL